MSSSSTKRYLHFKQSQGSLCDLPSTHKGIPYSAVGTTRCRTCLGFYLQFSDKTVFIAHISAQNYFPEEPTSPASSSSNTAQSSSSMGPPYSTAQIEKILNLHNSKWTSSLESGNRLKAFVLAQLHAQPWANKRSEVTEAFVVTTGEEQQEGVSSDKSNARWISSAIADFLSPLKVQMYKAHGFVAGPEVPRELFGWREYSGGGETVAEREREPGSYGWENCGGQEVLPMGGFGDMEWGQWAFCCKDGVWETCRRAFGRDSAERGSEYKPYAKAGPLEMG